MNKLIDNTKKDHVTVRNPQYPMWLTIIILVGFCAYMMATNSFGEKMVLIAFVYLVLLTIARIYMTLVWKIDVFINDGYFIYRNVFYKEYKVICSDCIGWQTVKTRRACIMIKTSDLVLNIPIADKNIKFLTDMLEKNKVPVLHE